MYKIHLDDNSFIIADDEYQLSLYRHGKHVNIAVKDFLTTKKYWKYHMVDLIDGKKVKRGFLIEPIKKTDFKVGSRIKLAQDILENDLIMGADGKPRKVVELHTGEDDMYEINVNGTTYTVNGGHILALVDRDTGEHLEIPVNVYMHLDDDFRSHYVMETVVEEE